MTRFRWRWVWLIFLALAVAGVARLRFDVEILNLLPGKLAVTQGLKVYQQHFSNARELILTLEAPTAEEATDAAQALARVLTDESNLVAEVNWRPAWMVNPAQATELVAFLWLNQPPAVFGELTGRLSAANRTNTLAETREQLATSFSPKDLALRGYDPYGLTQLPESVSGAAPTMGTGEELFASPEGTFRLLFVEAKPNLTSYPACREWLGEIRRIVTEAQRAGQIPVAAVIHYTGRPAFVTEIAGGMENDMVGSAGGTLVTIGVLFWLTHRRLRPLVWLLCLLVAILAGTAALGGLFLGAINVVSLGFAAILLGLAEDFGIVIYQESRSHPEFEARELRREVAPGIFWSAVTTAGAFLTLNLSTMPGLAQLGTLVAIGIILAAVVMLHGFLPPLLRMRRARDAGGDPGVVREKFLLFNPQKILPARIIWIISAVLLLLAAGVLWKDGPRFDHSPNVLKPKNSEANAALEQIKARFGARQEPLWVLVPGGNESQVNERLVRVNAVLDQAVSNRLIAGFTLPTALWPQPENQQANRLAVAALLREQETLREAALAAGFRTNSLFLTDSILESWRSAVASPGVFWPTNHASHWILGKVAARSTNGLLALGLVHPTTNAAATKRFAATWPDELLREGVIVSGWDLLGTTVFDTVVRELPRVLIPIAVLVVISLWLAFRNHREVGLSLVALAFSGVCLWATMDVLGWDWNILNLMALPLLLGMGVDFGIHIQLALRRYDGDLLAVRRSVGRALLLAGATTVAGFASLSFSTNAGMASLGKVCALGITLALVTAVYLLPVWWRFAVQRPLPADKTTPAPAASRLYGATLWRCALALTRMLPAGVITALCRLGASVYARCAGARRAVVGANLLPVLGGDRASAERTATALFDQFGRKLADLWRYESGRPVDELFGELTGFEHFQAAQAAGRGVLLLTPHLGNWEFGAPLLARRGIKLLVITLAEPGRGFTEMRQAARERWGIETLVIGEDPFAFVEVIKRLAAGATVALLVDRPPAASAVEVELFGHPFLASIAPAELARASGAALLPVVLPRVGHGYAARILPEITYDRRALGTREARRELTQQILRAFEPALRQHPDQWFHFVPVWSRP